MVGDIEGKRWAGHSRKGPCRGNHEPQHDMVPFGQLWLGRLPGAPTVADRPWAGLRRVRQSSEQNGAEVPKTEKNDIIKTERDSNAVKGLVDDATCILAH